MSTAMKCVLRCDHDGCDQALTMQNAEMLTRSRQSGTRNITATQTRHAAQAAGWKYAIRARPDNGPAPTFDFCPEHAGDVGVLGLRAVVLS